MVTTMTGWKYYHVPIMYQQMSSGSCLVWMLDRGYGQDTKFAPIDLANFIC